MQRRELRLPAALYGEVTPGSATSALDPKRASKDQDRHYNLRRREWRPSLGSMVLLRQHQLSNAAEGFAAKLAPKFDGPYRVVKFISPNIVRLAREGELKRRVANVMQLKSFYQEEDGEDGECHPQEAGETRPAGSKNVTNP
ncbi:hypothetical protein ACLKA6_018802 [Drosophila palustris]